MPVYTNCTFICGKISYVLVSVRARRSAVLARLLRAVARARMRGAWCSGPRPVDRNSPWATTPTGLTGLKRPPPSPWRVGVRPLTHTRRGPYVTPSQRSRHPARREDVLASRPGRTLGLGWLVRRAGAARRPSSLVVGTCTHGLVHEPACRPVRRACRRCRPSCRPASS
jgi:hypothetical protein